MDPYTFGVQASDTLLVRVAVTAGFTDPDVRIYRRDGTLLCSDSTIFALLEISCLADTTGEHTVLVGDTNGVETGNYSLHLQRTNDPANATPIQFGQTLTGSVALVPEMGAFSFNAQTGDQVMATVVVSSGNLDPDIRLYRPNGTLLCSDSTILPELELSCLLDSTGTQTILVGDSGGSDTGNYSLTLECTSPSCLTLDTDNDGCTDEQELGPNPIVGGLRDPNYFWDFSDVWTGSPPEKNRAVSISDVGAVVARFGATRETVPTKQDALAEAQTPPPPAPAYHAAFDRGGPIPGQNLWNLLPPDGSINIGDIGAIVAQFGHSCG